jgi:hypothetical protein
MPDASAAVLAVTDRAGQRSRRLEAIGDEAQLTVTDAGYSLWQVTGDEIDSHPPADPEPSYIQLIVDQWQRLIERPATAHPPASRDHARALACVEACLLSARTGQPENPRKLLEMHR